jgi:hypothetical protein
MYLTINRLKNFHLDLGENLKFPEDFVILVMPAAPSSGHN